MGLSAVGSDLRFAVQTWRRAPVLALTIVATLALGIGISTAVFSVASGVLLNVVPWSDPDRLVAIQSLRLRDGSFAQGTAPSVFVDWGEQASSLEGMAASKYSAFTLGDEDSVSVEGARVTVNALGLFRVPLASGRGFAPRDVEDGADPVVILSWGLWNRRFGADASIVGRRIVIDGAPTTVIGVLARDQFYPAPWSELLTPLRVQTVANERGEHSLLVIGLLRETVTLAQAQSELDVIAARLERQYPGTDDGWTVAVRPVQEIYGG